ncbi:MAG: Holliday junction ATP-dependent DNA helicase RuvA [Candidatus Uhrbacteria bacterium GW2011_GWD2_52_7]|uniref:Holliday junction branch migration complex subunit RuvA n=1 Tax=Candidatus Uhrbacteria bacterium GW2011_GWD2_52_7 TaxID=1618989 RepID=A0A0G1XHI9_9BACT|nr:MAG: Holliday junction ATP-dependent DNA helicase RuvA [Candidatus Uhrbacteria bacterium GW2011_GWD2_52_7]
MIALIEGSVALHQGDAIVVLAAGVGYRIFVARTDVEVGDVRRWFISEVIREDRHDLYGFASHEELVFFEQLIGVQGVGPKMGQKIMAAGPLSTVAARIQGGDIAFLSSISGVGKKTAQKIILELKGVLVSEGGGAMVQDEVSEALLGLGYTKQDIADIAEHITGDTSEQRLKSALKYLAR